MAEETFGGMPDLAPKDIGQLVQALLESIGRGELEASPDEVRFLRSVMDLLEPSTPA
jgi:hypothetical protein